MAGGGGGGPTWIIALVVGALMCLGGYGVNATAGLEEGQHSWLAAGLLGVGGLGVIFGSCEAMIKAVEGVGEKLKWNEFVAGTIAGLASNIPEVVMLAFVIANTQPRVAFVVVALTLHVSALVLGIYCGLLPRDQSGAARLPEPMVKLSTDLFACAGAIFLVVGSMMIMIRAFETGDHLGEGLGVLDLYFLGAALLMVEVVAISQLMARFAGDDDQSGVTNADEITEESKTPATAQHQAEAGQAGPPAPDPSGDVSWGTIGLFSALGITASVLGGHGVGDFADTLVSELEHAGYPEMIGAIILSLFACAGAYLMVATAHFKGKYDLALANISGQVNQVPFVVMPISFVLMAVFAQTGVLGPDQLPDNGAVLAIDLETTSVMLFGFPIMLILWKSVQDDGKVNWLETAVMIAVFALIVFFLAVHG